MILTQAVLGEGDGKKHFPILLMEVLYGKQFANFNQNT